ncbi:glycosyltransferase [Candidatus Minimicrobia naudis]|uniref:Glycosyltransferase n=1 Tax=Candidatus Minimicrobia naudis TaxID=2841263 RepID=A0A8F1MCR4_9BACT|nr:glycosyltransferase [Candidatus Minimicrobia naudis]
MCTFTRRNLTVLASSPGILWFTKFEQQGLLMADRIIAVSEITKEIIVKNYHIPPEKIEVVYNAIDLADSVRHTSTTPALTDIWRS